MKPGLLVYVLSGALAAASASQAGEVTFAGGLDYVSDYVSNGISQTNGKPTLQAYIEADLNGFYAGTWISGVDFGNADSAEIDLYLGYRTTFDNGFFLDAGYARYLYDDTGDCCGEFKVTGVIPVQDKLGLEGYVAYDPSSGNFNKAATLAYAVTDRFGLSGTYGRTDSNSNTYWHVGASMAFNDYFSGDIRYHGADSGDEGVVFKLSLATSQDNFARLLAAPFGR
jgi:uncharacterized protein (TIGR02001 family)